MTLVQFDHAVVVVNDELRARAFYQDFLGASVEHEFVRGGPDGSPLKGLRRCFLNLNDRGHVIGLFEDVNSVPEPKDVRGYPAVVLRVAPETYSRAVDELIGIEVDAAIPGFDRTFYTHDTEGNPMGFTAGPKAMVPMLLRLEVDTPNLAEGVDFYQGTFELELAETGVLPGDDHLPYAWLTVGDEGQGVLLVERPEAPGEYLGHHYAFLVKRADHLAMKQDLAARGINEFEERGRPDARPDGEVGTYLLDPQGRMLQWITHETSE